MSNYVSTVQLNTTFEISSAIKNPTFSLTPTSDPTVLAINPALLFTYVFSINSNQLVFNIGMQSGSNVELKIFTGDESNPNVPNIQISTTGEWNNGVNNVLFGSKTYNYLNPGDYNIVVNISNAISYSIFTKSVSFISYVDGLTPSLAQNPVVYKALSGIALAEFVFSYAGLSKAGSHSTVTFWPGDVANSAQGPFPLGMDFSLNKNMIPLTYVYGSTGSYTCAFLVSNLLGSMQFSVTFLVVNGLDGFYIDVDPKMALPGQVVNINAYMIYGDTVQLAYFQNGAQIGATIPRVCTLRLLF